MLLKSYKGQVFDEPSIPNNMNLMVVTNIMGHITKNKKYIVAKL